MGVLVASFAATTLDTATRIQRYVVSELATDYGIKPLSGRYAATTFAVVSAAILALVQGGGKGGLILWPLFGTTNQLLAGLAPLIATVYLIKNNRNPWPTALPMVFMIGVTGWAMVIKIFDFTRDHDWHLVTIGLLILLLEIWMIVETIVSLNKYRRDKLNLQPGSASLTEGTSE